MHIIEADDVATERHGEVKPLWVVAVIVTRDRPALLRACLNAVLGQARAPDEVIVVDNQSGAETRTLLQGYPAVRCLRLTRNLGGAGGFRAGIELAMQRQAVWLWLMDDDGRPAGKGCLGTLLETAQRRNAGLVGAMVVDVDERQRLAFPVRVNGRTLFEVEALARHGPVAGFAHLFNGVLVRAAMLRRIGLPDARFFIRGDEVEFLYRARQAGERIVLDTTALFLHPGSQSEIHPIMWGHFYAVVPGDEAKQFYQFRNRGYIFRRYRMWGWMSADLARYGWYLPGQSSWGHAGAGALDGCDVVRRAGQVHARPGIAVAAFMTAVPSVHEGK